MEVYLADRYREFLREEQGYTGTEEIPSLRDAHAEYFDLDEPLSEREFNTEQRLVVVGTDFGDVSLNIADFLREHGIDVVAVEYSTYRDEEEGIELLTTDGIRRPLSEEPASVSGSTSRSDSTDYSHLTATIRDQVSPEVRDQLDMESSDEVSATGSRLRFESNHPAHPDEVLYAADPRIAEAGRVHVQVSIIGADDDLTRV